MPILGGLLFAVQIMFAIHAVRNGKERFWMYFIIFVPGVGCLVYFITQVLPELGHNQVVRKTGNSLLKTFDPARELKKRKQELQRADTIENRTKLAEECLDANFISESINLYESCLNGMHENNPHILLKLSQALYENDDFEKTKQTLERLIEANPDYKSHEGHLLYARTLDALDFKDEAIEEYGVLTDSYPGEEARVRFGLLLQKMGKTEQATHVFQQTVQRSGLAPKYYRNKEKNWIKIAQDNIH